jgi:hypothetical protein
MPQRQTISIRLPDDLLAQAREAKAPRESLNELVVAALEREVRRRQGEAALGKIRKVREQVQARTGLQPDPVPLIRALREGEGRRD